jgi:hypothetical protein
LELVNDGHSAFTVFDLRLGRIAVAALKIASKKP